MSTKKSITPAAPRSNSDDRKLAALRPKLVSQARRKVPAGEVDDVVSDAIVSIVRLRKYAGLMPEEALARKILKDVIADRCRKTQRRRRRVEATHADALSPDHAEPVDMEAEIARVMDGPEEPRARWSSREECIDAVRIEARARASQLTHWPSRWRHLSGGVWMREATENMRHKDSRIRTDAIEPNEQRFPARRLADRRRHRRIMIEDLLSVFAADVHPISSAPVRPTRRDLTLLALLSGDFPGVKDWARKGVSQLIECMAYELDAAVRDVRRGRERLYGPLAPTVSGSKRAPKSGRAERERREAVAYQRRLEAQAATFRQTRTPTDSDETGGCDGEG